ncbi:MAG: OmpA family protein [Geobacteraceae bacterium]|nr:OmpA family protein [Geobacteraceae bacterium]
MRSISIALFLAPAFLLLASCAGERNLVVLLPDSEGKTGSIVVSNQAGSQLISVQKQATVISSATTAPSPPAAMDDEAVRKNFGAALDALPLPPIHFILYFKTDSTELTDESRRLLATVLPATVDRKSTDVSVVGHTDRVGTREYNYNLGLERALLVRKMLVYLGIEEGLIEVASHGEDNPLVKTADEVQEPRNRRVEVVVR